MNSKSTFSDIEPVEISLFVLTLVLAGIHLYLGVFAPELSGDRSTQFIFIGIAFLAGVIARATPLWRPILYLLAAAFGFYLNVLWILDDAELSTIGIATGGLTVVFSLLAIYLFVRVESSATTP